MYVDLPFWHFLLAILIVSIPAAVLERSGEQRAASYYILLILFATLIANWRGVQAFSRFVGYELGSD